MKSFTAIMIIIVPQFGFAQLNEGAVMFVGYDADEKNLAFLAINDIPNGTTLYFTDNEWNELAIGSGGGWNDTNEGFLEWEADTEITGGTVVIFNETDNTSNITTNAGNITRHSGFNISATDETVYCYTGSDPNTPTIFISAFSNSTFVDGTLTNTGLSAGMNAISISGDEDVCVYTGTTTCNDTKSDCASTIADNSNWITQDGSGSQSSDSTAPDWPDDLITSFTGSALPVTWLLVSAKATSSYHYLIQWSTASEINNDYFEIEVSENGVDFSCIGKVKGSGNSKVVQDYEYTYFDPLADLLYFRIKQVDYDGQFDYSKIVMTKSPSLNSTYYIANNKLHLQKSSEIHQIRILSISGNVLTVFDDTIPEIIDLSAYEQLIIIQILGKENYCFRHKPKY